MAGYVIKDWPKICSIYHLMQWNLEHLSGNPYRTIIRITFFKNPPLWATQLGPFTHGMTGSHTMRIVPSSDDFPSSDESTGLGFVKPGHCYTARNRKWLGNSTRAFHSWDDGESYHEEPHLHLMTSRHRMNRQGWDCGSSKTALIFFNSNLQAPSSGCCEGR
jgi:hypothetical protein